MTADNNQTRSAGAQMFANRLQKNLRHLGRWLKREHIHCYRLYDADIPEYAVAVDVYQGEQRWVHIQEYQAPRQVDANKAEARLREAVAVCGELLEVPASQLFVKVRRQQKGKAQYQKLAGRGQFHSVEEAGKRFLVNFTDYLDTGLFLDHRITRALLGDLAAGRHFLNLFAYTGSATVYAGSGAAASTTSVDLSKTYLDWARRNMQLNRLEGPQHHFVQADCLAWLQANRARRRFGLIFLDPPSFSTSKRMQTTFDVQRDHVALIKATADLLQPNGVFIFSNNRRRFSMDHAALAGLVIENISRSTLPRDFERNPRIHNCWKITHPGGSG
jgi:23S rRNA (guanine2445-N2)-methyltransferase / 23S rRNA (guanine2069-N7)-methyltransferase